MFTVFLGAGVIALVAIVVAWRVVQQDRRRSEARVAMLAEAIDGNPVAAVPEPPPVPRSRHAVPVVGAVLAAALAMIVGAALLTGIRERAAQPVDSTAAPADLELLSMRHDQAADGYLTVTGLVRNGGPAHARQVIAVIFAFDRDGGFLSSGRAPLDFSTLSPGDESPFRVSLREVEGVGRYRVSFRTEDGLLPHVDRRQRAQAQVRSQ